MSVLGAGSFDPYDWQSFYFGKMGRDDATRLLTEDGIIIGTFLLRDSSHPGDFSLSVREAEEGSQVRHYLIEKTINEQGAAAVKIAEQTFVDVAMLLNHFKMRILDKTSLTVPYRKRELERVVGLYKFEGDKEGDLPFEAGEELEIIGKPQEEWWQARNALNNTGVVPSNYVGPTDEESSGLRGHSNISSLSSGSGGVDRFSGLSMQSVTDEERYEPTLPATAVVTSDRLPNAYDTIALKLKKGQRIEVLKKLNNGLYEGVLNGKQGTFPHTYVKWLRPES